MPHFLSRFYRLAHDALSDIRIGEKRAALRRRARDGAAGEGLVLCKTVSEALDPEIGLRCT